jgi:hypothetical protein
MTAGNAMLTMKKSRNERNEPIRTTGNIHHRLASRTVDRRAGWGSAQAGCREVLAMISHPW